MEREKYIHISEICIGNCLMVELWTVESIAFNLYKGRRRGIATIEGDVIISA